jgi:ABC-type antimicrobial peptide transport system permease subunit
VLTTFFVTWISARQNFFYDHVDSQNWLNDDIVSYSGIKDSSGNIAISSDHLESKINEAQERLTNIIPGVGNKYTAGLYLQLRYYQPNFTQIHNMKLLAFDAATESIIGNNLAEGRMPVSDDELIFYRSQSSYPFVLNQSILLGNSISLGSHIFNYTIVGIIDDAESVFYQNGKSQDMFQNITQFDPVDYNDIFITTNSLYAENTVKLVAFEGVTAFLIDFDYEFQASHVRKVSKAIRRFRSEELEYFQSYNDEPFCFDLYFAFSVFRDDWDTQTITIFTAGVPFLLILGLVCLETFQIGNHVLESRFKIMKVQGMEYKTIRNMVLLENFLSSLIFFIGGFLLGILIGYFIYLGMIKSQSKDFFLALGDSVMLISLSTMFLLFFLGGFIIENYLARKTNKTTSLRYKEKRKSVFRSIFSSQEFMISIPGLVMIAIGFIGLYLAQIAPYGSAIESYFSEIFLIFWFIIITGAIFELASVLLLISRAIAFIWGKIGKAIWNKTKSYFTLSFKHIAIYNQNFRRVILGALIIGIGITPGIIMKKSINDHIPIESNLAVGYADAKIPNWTTVFDDLKDDIEAIEGIEATAKVKVYTIYAPSNLLGGRDYLIQLFSILNTTEFLNTINPRFFDDSRISPQNLVDLENELTYLMNEKYVKKNNYHRGVNFTTTMLAGQYLEPLDMNYVNYYDIFPFLESGKKYYFDPYIRFGMVTSEETAEALIDYSSYQISTATANYLLLKTSSESNYTYIQEVIESLGVSMISYDEVEQNNFDMLNDFNINLFLIGTFLSIAAAIFIGFITARSLYYQRVRIIESEYQIGANRKQIWGSFTLEILMIVIAPVLLSFGIIYPLLSNLSSLIMFIPEDYLSFNLWFPIWIFFLLILLIVGMLFAGWLPGIIYLVRKYRPIKQE